MSEPPAERRACHGSDHDTAPSARPPTGGGPTALALIGAGILVALLLAVVGRPLATDDLWFHLKMGEVYATQTLWPETDPMLFTAGDQPPVQHEWLFGVAVFGLERLVGLQGLRVVHLLAFGGILWLVFASFRRESRSALPAVLATCVFLVLSWRRLYQLRPDLISIPATIALVRLLFDAEEGPSWRRIALATGLVGFWANVHSLFGAGLVLGAAGGIGMWLRSGFETRLPATQRRTRARAAGRIAVAIGLGFLAALINPRGIGQHLTFFTSTRDAAIWLVRDEWTPFNPFSPPATSAPGIDLLSWLTMDALMLLVIGVAIAGGLAFLQRPTRERLRIADPALGAIAFASAIAALISIRFLWMSFFMLLFLLRSYDWGLSPLSVVARRIGWGMAGTALVLGIAFVRMDTWQGIASEVQRERGGYLATPYLTHRYCASGIRFLKEAALQGNLFNPYHVGGYAGYRLSPRIRTFIDGRTEHYPPEVMHDYLKIIRAPAWPDRRTAFRLLEDYEIDLFLGAGLPEGYYSNLYTVELIAGKPRWILVYRTVDHAIYLRRNPRNLENLKRIAKYYEERGIPFDLGAGFVPHKVIESAPSWAIDHGMIPTDFPEIAARRESANVEERFHALDTIGNVYWLLGDRSAQIEADLAAVVLRPQAREPRRRLADTYLRERRFEEAEELARALYESDPSDARTRMLYEYMIRRRYAR